MSRAAWMMALALVLGCEHEKINPAPMCYTAADCNDPIDDRCSAWVCNLGVCGIVPVAPVAADGGAICGDLPMCSGVCVYPDGGESPGHCEGAASAPVVCGGDGTCDDGNPCTIDQGLAPECLHYNVPLGADCERGTCDGHGVCCNQCFNQDNGHCVPCPPPN